MRQWKTQATCRGRGSAKEGAGERMPGWKSEEVLKLGLTGQNSAVQTIMDEWIRTEIRMEGAPVEA
jgi:hypothetical protein